MFNTAESQKNFETCSKYSSNTAFEKWQEQELLQKVTTRAD